MPIRLKSAVKARLLALAWCLGLVLASIPVYGQVATLTNVDHSLTATLSAAPATTQPTYSVLWTGQGGPSDSLGSTTGVTAKTMLTGLAGGNRDIQSVQIFNGDTADITLTIAKVVSGTSYNLLSATIPVGGNLRWTKERGIEILNTRGVVSTSPTSTAGTIAAGLSTTCTVAETGIGNYYVSTFTLTALALTVADATQGTGQKIYNFPEGRILVLGATGNATFTTTSILANTLNIGVSCRWGVGTATQSQTTLATTEQDLLPVTTFTSSATINTANTVTNAALAASAQFDGTSTAKDAYFNVSVPGATDIDADSNVAVNGTITIVWLFLGDY